MKLEAKWDTHDERWIVRHQETYKGITWMCKGTSTESKAKANESYIKARDKKILLIDQGFQPAKERQKFKDELNEWYDTYKRYSRSGGRPRSARTIQTDEDTMRQLNKEFGDYEVSSINHDMIQRQIMMMRYKNH